MKKGRVGKGQLVKAARDRVAELFSLAEKHFKQSRQKSNDFVRKARNLAMKHRLRIPFPWNRRYCRNCLVLLVPGSNARVRTREGKLIVMCFSCKNIRRHPLTQKGDSK